MAVREAQDSTPGCDSEPHLLVHYTTRMDVLRRSIAGTRAFVILSFLAAVLSALPSCARTVEEQPVVNADASERLETATFAGGCFWCMEPAFEALDGVKDVVVGYAGGEMENPTYEDVLFRETGHYEAAQIAYDPDRISYARLLETFWRQIDPTDAGGQFADRGAQYQTAIFYHDLEQKALAEKSMQELERSGKFDRPIVTQILPFKAFYPAEDYHQNYYKTCPVSYNSYKWGSGRGPFLESTWPEEDGT